MSYNSPFDHNAGPPGTYAGPAAEIDLGLRQHMMRVYNFMAAGLAPASSHMLQLQPDFISRS